MIEEDTVSVLVPYRGLPGGPEHEAIANRLLREFRDAATGRNPSGARALLRRAQPYLVAVRKRQLDEAVAQAQGLATELVGGIWAWEGGYDDVRGLTWTGRGAAELVV